MSRRLAAAALVAAAACSEPARDAGSPAPPPAAAPGVPSPAPGTSRSSPERAAVRSHLTIRGTRFYSGDAAFDWRGITAFRLAEFIARGREADAAAYLDWARDRKLTVLRVLVMAHHLFQLKPDEGLAALPRLLELASARGLHVEVVALADTAEIPVDLEQHVAAVAKIAAAHPNALLEIANEPWHPTQDRRLHDPSYVGKLAALVPAQVPVALGSVEKHDGYAAAGYVTWHSPRSAEDGGWGHALAAADSAALVSRWQKPVVSDEPIGAAAEFVPGRRDNEPARFGAAAAVTRLSGSGATFHYEGGLQARIPAGRERACFDAWMQGLDALSGMPAGGEFLPAAAMSSVARVSDARAAFGRRFEQEVWVVAVDPQPGLKLEWASGYKPLRESRLDGLAVWRAGR